MVRSIYLVAYDISDQSRLRIVFRTMRAYGDSLQFSVFLCRLSSKERILLLTELSEIINHAEDRILIVDLGGSNSKERIEFLGASDAVLQKGAVVI
jgi:CRISPR-associated protein Cas2